jgi:hypothetical protein
MGQPHHRSLELAITSEAEDIHAFDHLRPSPFSTFRPIPILRIYPLINHVRYAYEPYLRAGRPVTLSVRPGRAYTRTPKCKAILLLQPLLVWLGCSFPNGSSPSSSLTGESLVARPVTWKIYHSGNHGRDLPVSRIDVPSRVLHE